MRDWIVGPVFGATVLVWQMNLKRPLIGKSIAFLISSTLIYAVVSEISGLWSFPFDLLDIAAGSLTAGVIFGSVALPIAQIIIFPETRQSSEKLSFL